MTHEDKGETGGGGRGGGVMSVHCDVDFDKHSAARQGQTGLRLCYGFTCVIYFVCFLGRVGKGGEGGGGVKERWKREWWKKGKRGMVEERTEHEQKEIKNETRRGK